MKILNTKRQSETRNKESLSPDSCLLTSDFCHLHSAPYPLPPISCTLHQKNGFTLIELIMTIIILGFASLIMIPFVTSIANSPDPVIRQRAISLGQALMDEILAKKWDENTPMGGGPICTTLESPNQATRPNLIDACITQSTIVASLGNDGETRVNYDDVDDYDGLTETNNFVDQNNTAFNLQGYRRTAGIAYIASNSNPVTGTVPAASAGTTDTKRIIVTVTSPRGETFEFIALKCNY